MGDAAPGRESQESARLSVQPWRRVPPPHPSPGCRAPPHERAAGGARRPQSLALVTIWMPGPPRPAGHRPQESQGLCGPLWRPPACGDPEMLRKTECKLKPSLPGTAGSQQVAVAARLGTGPAPGEVWGTPSSGSPLGLWGDSMHKPGGRPMGTAGGAHRRGGERAVGHEGCDWVTGPDPEPREVGLATRHLPGSLRPVQL